MRATVIVHFQIRVPQLGVPSHFMLIKIASVETLFGRLGNFTNLLALSIIAQHYVQTRNIGEELVHVITFLMASVC